MKIFWVLQVWVTLQPDHEFFGTSHARVRALSYVFGDTQDDAYKNLAAFCREHHLELREMIASVAVPNLDELNPEGSAHAEQAKVNGASVELFGVGTRSELN